MEIVVDRVPEMGWNKRRCSVQRFEMFEQSLFDWKLERGWPLIVIVDP